MINKIYGSPMAPKQNNLQGRQQTSFGVAYPLESKAWHKAISTADEKNIILRLFDKANSGSIKYIGSDSLGLTHRFALGSGEIAYTPSKVGLMSNLKSSEHEVYIIENGSSDVGQTYNLLARFLDSVVKKHSKTISKSRYGDLATVKVKPIYPTKVQTQVVQKTRTIPRVDVLYPQPSYYSRAGLYNTDRPVRLASGY